ncbi:hypothetical protein [Ktedonobacter robiniae]|uniref:hypothetical protein n=1 Tax=Ktedonobacter robiniae TaxID=2778365 RepID=UPI003B75BBEB
MGEQSPGDQVRDSCLARCCIATGAPDRRFGIGAQQANRLEAPSNDPAVIGLAVQ